MTYWSFCLLLNFQSKSLFTWNYISSVELLSPQCMAFLFGAFRAHPSSGNAGKSFLLHHFSSCISGTDDAIEIALVIFQCETTGATLIFYIFHRFSCNPLTFPDVVLQLELMSILRTFLLFAFCVGIYVIAQVFPNVSLLLCQLAVNWKSLGVQFLCSICKRVT